MWCHSCGRTGIARDKLCRSCGGTGKAQPVMLRFDGRRVGLAPSLSAALRNLKNNRYPVGTEVIDLETGDVLNTKVDPDESVYLCIPLGDEVGAPVGEEVGA